jgi:hypothetical protein
MKNPGSVTMRDEDEILREINEAKVAYADAAEKKPAAVVRDHAERVKELQVELSLCYTRGADPCPKCGNYPHGMDRNGSVYEVGCLVCPPELRDGKRRSYSAQGRTPEKAVANWNAGVYVEDDYLDKIPH